MTQLVNDVHSRLNETRVDRIVRPSSVAALASNVHGRGLRLAPIVGDVVAFTLLDADGALHRCDRVSNADLFRLAIGGYGLFGLVTSVRLRLAPRIKLQRFVELLDADD